MSRQIFVNIPVKNLERSMEFFTSLGFGFNPEFTDDKAACMIVSDNIYVMLLVESFFATFTKKEICDAARYTEALICLSCDSRDEVDRLVAQAAVSGGKISRDPKDYGFMYEHAFEDPDGHIWELVHMNPE